MPPSIKPPRVLLCALTWLLAFSPGAGAQHAPLPHELGASGLGLALRRLPVTARVLVVTAHPDDENNAVLVALSQGRGLETALLTLTRGDGGQNAIGPELNEALAVLRSEELAAVHRYDAVRQYFGQAFEFGFSVSLDETLSRWGREETLADVVRVVRAFRPDVILTLPLSDSGHQHHAAAALLTRQAFRAAADAARFPEQIAEGLRAWQASKLYEGGVGSGGGPDDGAGVVLRVGTWDPLLGVSWAEFGGLARAQHRSQGPSAPQLRAGPGALNETRFRLVDAQPPVTGAEADILAGLDVSFAGLLRFAPEAERPQLAAALSELEAEARRAQADFDAQAPENTLPALRAGLERVRALRESAAERGAAHRHELLDRLDASEAEFERALLLGHGLAFRATSDDGDVTRGQSFRVTASVWNQGREPLELAELELSLPDGWAARRVAGEPGPLAPGAGRSLVFAVEVGAAARFSQPYWHRVPGAGRYAVQRAADRGQPWSAPDVVARLSVRSGGVVAGDEQPVVWRYAGRWVGGEKQKVVNVVPELSLRLSPEMALFPLSAGEPATREFRVSVLSQRQQPAAARLWLAAPEGWRVEPAEIALRPLGENEEAALRFRVTPPAGLAPGVFELRAWAACEGQEYSDGYQVVAYHHIQERHLLKPARATARALDVQVAADARIGYVMGVGDELPEAIHQLGLALRLIDPDELADGELSGYTTIVLGVRAYHARADLRAHHQRLMRYVERGGHLVVQYQRSEFNPADDGPSPYAPYPARAGNRRVTDENAPIQVLEPGASLLRSPNLLGAGDWSGWVQERGAQFLDTNDASYRELLAAADPFPANPGAQKGLLVEAQLGQGTWTYVGLGLYRQLPAGTPGAYRLLANLLSRPQRR